jgi:hypothetical protein
MQPERYRDNPGAFAALREQLNDHLVSCDFRINEDGSLKAADGPLNRSTIPTWDLAASSYIRVFRNFGLIVGISWAPMLAGLLVVWILGAATVRFRVPLALQNPMVLQIISEVLFIPFAAIFLVAWHRCILLDEKPKRSWFYFSISKREMLFALAGLAFLAMRLPQFATSFGYLYLMSRKMALGGHIDQWDIWLAPVVSWSWLIVLVPVYARLLWVLPEIAIDKGFRMHRCWRLTRGNTWRLTMGLVLVIVPFLGLQQVTKRLFVFNGIDQVLVEVLLFYFVTLLVAVTTATYLSLTYEFANATKEAEEST